MTDQLKAQWQPIETAPERVRRLINQMMMNAPAVPFIQQGTETDPCIMQAAWTLHALSVKLQEAEAERDILRAENARLANALKKASSYLEYLDAALAAKKGGK